MCVCVCIVVFFFKYIINFSIEYTICRENNDSDFFLSENDNTGYFLFQIERCWKTPLCVRKRSIPLLFRDRPLMTV